MSHHASLCGLYDDAVSIARADGRVSIMHLQRKLSVGYIAASRLIEAMLETGVIHERNPQDGWHRTKEEPPHAP